jgi:hypothetical protein
MFLNICQNSIVVEGARTKKTKWSHFFLLLRLGLSAELQILSFLPDMDPFGSCFLQNTGTDPVQ